MIPRQASMFFHGRMGLLRLLGDGDTSSAAVLSPPSARFAVCLSDFLVHLTHPGTAVASTLNLSRPSRIIAELSSIVQILPSFMAWREKFPRL
jgi:hypothetical protein